MKPELIGVLTLSKDKELEAIVYNDPEKRVPVFYAVKKMGVDDIKELFEKNNE